MLGRKRKLTAGQKAFDQFLDDTGYPDGPMGILAPPMSDTEALDILRMHFANDFIIPYSAGRDQYNCELVYYILRKYKGEV